MAVREYIHQERLLRTERAKKLYRPNLSSWMIIPHGMREDNVRGKAPRLKAKLGGQRTNEELAKEWGVTKRTASKIRNYKIPMPRKESQ